MNKILISLVLFFIALPGGAGAKELYVYNWSEFMPDSVLEDFRKETGIKVVMSTYDSNEALYAKIKMVGGQGYDLIVPSTDYVSRMHQEGLLRPLDKTLLSNLAHLDPQLLDHAFDPGNVYSLPYLWGSTALAINTQDPVAATITSYADLWKPEMRGKLLLPNDMRGVLAIGLKRLGYSLNELDADKIKEACDLLLPLMDNVRVFDSDSPKQALLNNEVQVAVLWNGEAYIAAGENPAIQYIYPPEGYSLWIDNLCIPKNAVNIENAHVFIDYLLRPEVAAFISQELGYSSPNKQALSLLPQEVRDNVIVYPDQETMSRGEFEISLDGAVKFYEQCWMKLKTRG